MTISVGSGTTQYRDRVVDGNLQNRAVSLKNGSRVAVDLRRISHIESVHVHVANNEGETYNYSYI